MACEKMYKSKSCALGVERGKRFPEVGLRQFLRGIPMNQKTSLDRENIQLSEHLQRGKLRLEHFLANEKDSPHPNRRHHAEIQHCEARWCQERCLGEGALAYVKGRHVLIGREPCLNTMLHTHLGLENCRLGTPALSKTNMQPNVKGQEAWAQDVANRDISMCVILLSVRLA